MAVDGEHFGRRQRRRSGVARAVVQDANGVGVARFGAQLIAAGDVNELIGPRAQIVANVANQLIEIAIAPDQFDQRVARDRRG